MFDTHGFFCVGLLKGLKEKPWQSSKSSGVEHILGVSIFRPDSWGGDSSTEGVFSFKIYSGEVARVKSFVDANIGKRVSIQFSIIPRNAGGKRWNEYAITKDCIFTVLEG